MKIALGTAQFGLPYGLANQRGQITQVEAVEILKIARRAGIDTIDTAISYGDSEACLGRAGISDLKVVTKLPPLPHQCADINQWVRDQVHESLCRLGIGCLYGVLLHQPAQLGGEHGDLLAASLRSLKSDGLVEKIGLSIYSPTELELAHDLSIDLIQAPFNIFDRRISNSGWLERLADRGVEVHARSVFLQGLLLMSSESILPKFRPWTKVLTDWHKWLSSNPKITPLHACLGFILNYPQITRVVVGVDSSRQFEQLLAATEMPLINDLPDFSCTDEMLINPSNWSSL